MSFPVPHAFDALRVSPATPPAHAGAGLAARLSAKYPDRITGALMIPGRAGRYAEFPDDLPPRLADALRARGVTRLYSHQAEAWAATIQAAYCHLHLKKYD